MVQVKLLGRSLAHAKCTYVQHVSTVICHLANLNLSHMLILLPTTAAVKLPIMNDILCSFCAWHLHCRRGGELPTPMILPAAQK